MAETSVSLLERLRLEPDADEDRNDERSESKVAGGHVVGELVFLHEREGFIARTRIEMSDASAADLLPGDGAISGRLRFKLAAEGSGVQPICC